MAGTVLLMGAGLVFFAVLAVVAVTVAARVESGRRRGWELTAAEWGMSYQVGDPLRLRARLGLDVDRTMWGRVDGVDVAVVVVERTAVDRALLEPVAVAVARLADPAAAAARVPGLRVDQRHDLVVAQPAGRPLRPVGTTPSPAEGVDLLTGLLVLLGRSPAE
ncbi:hypothetical protein EV189_3548 [Motilibacter rhizosphaerae]|uniref:Uncharacterized protein n=1 Tax=Motilibacter rhizosphaerae TaxID=598652 RepID=A0A4Q7NAU4_9ACTN|nr:hypothetical protein [Motilibacter rhizosphaerae]RZS80068.1 hypothetical protein EV189_3548 [Motilibacter rhizosphaerae]